MSWLVRKWRSLGSIDAPMLVLHRTTFIAIDGIFFALAIWRSNATRTSFIFGTVMIAFGCILRCASSVAQFQHGTPSIVGIYRLMRAPYLSGSTLIWLGAAVTSRQFELLLAGLAVAGIWGGIFILRAERMQLRPEQFVRTAYLRDVPLLVPQLLPFLYQPSLLESPKTNPFRSRAGLFREWAGMALILSVLVGIWGTMRYISLHREIASVISIVLVATVSYRIYRDFSGRVRPDFQMMLRF